MLMVIKPSMVDVFILVNGSVGYLLKTITSSL